MYNTFEEIDNWLKNTKEAGVTEIAFDVEDNWYKKHMKENKEYILKFYDYVMEEYPKYGINSCELYERLQQIEAMKQNGTI